MTNKHYVTPSQKTYWLVAFACILAVSTLGLFGITSSPEKAYASSGWSHQGKIWKYQKSNGTYTTGWLKSGGYWYYFNPKGVMQTGWYKVGNTWYYSYGSGVMRTGWMKSGSTWYYFDGSGAMATGWRGIGGSWYFFKDSGAMATGWVKTGGHWYYMASWGGMQTGWLKQGATWYYFNGSGAMVTNQWVGNYWMSASGKMAVNAWVDNGRYYVNASGCWTGQKRSVPKPTAKLATKSTAKPAQKPAAQSNQKPTSKPAAKQSTTTQKATTPSAANKQTSAPKALSTQSSTTQKSTSEKSQTNPSTSTLAHKAPAASGDLSYVGSALRLSDEAASGKAQYSYAVYLISNDPDLTRDFALFIKTNNPDKSTIKFDGTFGLNLDGHSFADVAYNDSKFGFMRQVPGGYLVKLSAGVEAGSHLVKLFENNAEIGSFAITTTDYDAQELKEFDKILQASTTSGMNSVQKLQAAAKYIQTNYHYSTYYQDKPDGSFGGYAMRLQDMGPWWVSHQLDSKSSPALLARLAQHIGGFTEIHDCFYDYPRDSQQWKATHYYCRVTYQGKQYNISACPDVSTAHVINPATETKVNLEASGTRLF